MKKLIFILSLSILMIASAQAQFAVLADSLASPLGVTVDDYSNSWVAEVGTGNNDGSITHVNKFGKKSKVITGLPSFFLVEIGDVAGPVRVVPMSYGKMAVIIGGGAGAPTDGNFGLLLIYNLAGFVPGVDAPKTYADAIEKIDVSAYVLSDTTLTDSNPFSAVQDLFGNWYIVDAGANAIYKFAKNGTKSKFASFPSIPNPTMIGGPFIDAVPTKIILRPGGKGFFVSNLTGFPFLKGLASIFAVDFSGNVTTYKSGLTLITDIALDKSEQLYALQFGSFAFGPMPGFQFGSGIVTRVYKHSAPDTIAKNFGPGAGMAITDKGHLYITSLFTAQLLKQTNLNKISSSSSVAPELEVRGLPSQLSISTYPNPTTDYVIVQVDNLKEWSPAHLRLTDLNGKTVFEKSNLSSSPLHRIDLKAFAAGTYFIQLNSNQGKLTKKIIVN